jgi:hypothetical protein
MPPVAAAAVASAAMEAALPTGQEVLPSTTAFVAALASGYRDVDGVVRALRKVPKLECLSGSQLAALTLAMEEVRVVV